MKKLKLWHWFLGGLPLVAGAAGGAAIAYKLKLAKPKAMIPATSGTKSSFIQMMKDSIGDQIPQAGRQLAIAWAAFESNWGRDTAFTKANNPWNITAGSKWTGPTVPGPDTEYDSNGNITKITQKWRQYNSVADAVGDMVTFLTISNSNNMAGRDLMFAGNIGFVDKLYAGHYFTLPPDQYKAGVNTCLADVQNLMPAVGVA